MGEERSGGMENHFDSMTLPPGICFLEVIRVCVGSKSLFPTGLKVSHGKPKFYLFLYPCHHHHHYHTTITTMASTTIVKMWSANTQSRKEPPSKVSV